MATKASIAPPRRKEHDADQDARNMAEIMQLGYDSIVKMLPGGVVEDANRRGKRTNTLQFVGSTELGPYCLIDLMLTFVPASNTMVHMLFGSHESTDVSWEKEKRAKEDKELQPWQHISAMQFLADMASPFTETAEVVDLDYSPTRPPSPFQSAKAPSQPQPQTRREAR